MAKETDGQIKKMASDSKFARIGMAASIVLFVIILTDIYLIVHNETTLSNCLVALSSLIYGALIASRVSAAGDDPGVSQLEANLREAQDIVHRNSYGVFRYIARGNANADVMHLGLVELLKAPPVWMFCLLLSVTLFLGPDYLSPQSVVALDRKLVASAVLFRSA